MDVEDIRARLQRELAPEQWLDVVKLISHAAAGGWGTRERTVTQLAAHFPGVPIRRVAEHVYALEADLSERRCPLCPAPAESE